VHCLSDQKGRGIETRLIKPEIDHQNWSMDCSYLAVLEFKPLKPGPVNLTSRIFERVQNSELWLNGKRIDKKNEYMTVLNLLPGVNRLVVKSPCNNYITVKIDLRWSFYQFPI